MASAVLSGNHEHYWGEKNAYMKKYGNAPDYDPNFRRLVPNPNPNPNPFLTRPSSSSTAPIRRSHVSHNAAAPTPRSAPPRQPAPSSKAPTTSFHDSNQRKCVTFHLSTYSERELKDLKKRLMSELDQVRTLRIRIEALPDSRSQNSVPPPVGLKKKKKKKKSISKGSTQPGAMRAPSFSSPQVSKLTTSMMRKCSQMLNKLMKHRHGWVFNKPVDTVSMGLHDYHTIIKNPMDLGTVKSRLLKKEYRTPLDFAGDVRLTFNNAMVYNSKGQDVYVMAQDLLSLFENMFNPAIQKFESDTSVAKKAQQKGVSLPVEPVLQDAPQVEPVGSGAKMGKAGKADKGRKRDLNLEGKSRKRDMKSVEKSRKREEKLSKMDMNVEAESKKRDMSFEEKSRLAVGLQDLPQAKLDEMVRIIKKRNLHLAPDSDEIEMELDIEVVDNETLWELDRLVSDHQKMVASRMNREPSPQPDNLVPVIQPEEVLLGSECSIEPKNKKGDAGEEDVDIGDEAPANFPPLQIEKDGSSSASGSSSSGDSSSSSDSDSSGSDSDGESVQSPYVQARGEGADMA